MIIFHQIFISVITQITRLFLKNTQFLLCTDGTFNTVSPANFPMLPSLSETLTLVLINVPTYTPTLNQNNSMLRT